MDSADAGNLESWLDPRSRSRSQSLTAARESAASALLFRLKAIGDRRPDRTARSARRRIEVAFSFRGLEFARWSVEGISFGLGDSRKGLTKSTEPALERLIHQLDLHRNSLATETNHRLYRKAPERWLETLHSRRSLKTRCSARSSAFLYSQVPALAAGDRGVLDLLGVTRRGGSW